MKDAKDKEIEKLQKFVLGQGELLEAAKLRDNEYLAEVSKFNELDERASAEIGELKAQVSFHKGTAEEALVSLDLVTDDNCKKHVEICDLSDKVAALEAAIDAADKHHVKCVPCGFIRINPPDNWECPKCRVAMLEQKLTVKSDRVALLESEMQIPNSANYKTAIEEAFDACSIAIDGDTGWEYPGQMVRAVESVVRERGEALARVAELEATAGLQKIIERCKGAVHVTVNDHTSEYATVEKYFARKSEHEGYEYDDDDKSAIARCIEAGTIFDIQAYPDTPIGSYTCFGSTLGQVVAEMLEVLDLTDQDGKGESDGSR